MLGLFMGAGVLGCSSNMVVSDSLGVEGVLNQPYAEGSEVSVDVVLPKRFRGDEGLSLRSSDHSVFDVGAFGLTDDGLFAILHTRASGIAELEFAKNGRLIDSKSIEVAVADDAVLIPAALERIGRGDATDVVDMPAVVVGGSATFRLVMLNQGRSMYGSATVWLVDEPKGADVWVDETYGEEGGPWITVAPEVDGEFTVALEVNESFDVPLSFMAVADDAIESLALIAQDEGQAEAGHTLGVTSIGYDSLRNNIFGLDPTWTLKVDAGEDGPQPEAGEIFWYQYDPEVPRVLEAQLGNADDITTIHGYPVVGCGGCSASPAALIPTMVLPLMVWRRKKGPARS